MIKGLLGLLAFGLGVSHASPADFYGTWSDGQAEIAGYQLKEFRYGQVRDGQAVLIYVTEPFSRARGVKVDGYDPKNPDHFIALKLNIIKRFQTGIYDYSIMTSLFADPQDGMQPVKQTFSSQEWCGHVYEELKFDAKGVEVDTRSYFDGETTKTNLRSGRTATLDSLWIIARGLTTGGPSGVTFTQSFLGSSTTRRLRHLPVQIFPAQPRWIQKPTNVTTRAGDFNVKTLVFNRQSGVECQMHIETNAPYRVIGWRCNDGEQATLTGSTRLAYWTRARLGDERLLKGLGLTPMSPETPGQ